MKIRPQETWFLRATDCFEDRMLKFAVCPKCSKHLARLIETRRFDGKKFDVLLVGDKAGRAADNYRSQIEYTSLDTIYVKGVLWGFRYGENRNRVNKKTGVTTNIQTACDFYGNKEVVKTAKQQGV